MNNLFAWFSTGELLLLTALLLLFIYELVYWLRNFGRVAFRKAKSQPVISAQPPVSIILSVRNEYVVLQQTLPTILRQDYPEFEVVVVNDGSEDDTELLLAAMQATYPHLVVRTIVKDEKFRHSKKMALGMGIKAARYELLLFTDADCFPSSDKWLQNMQCHFTEKIDLVIGYTPLTNTSKWIRADHFMQALHMLSRALLRKPYMGTHSNLAYRRRLFFANKGFDMRLTESMREDIVFVNKMATSSNTAVVLDKAAVTVSTLRYSFVNWVHYRMDELRSLALSENGPAYPAWGEAVARLLFFAGIVGGAIVFCSNHVILLFLLGAVLIRFTLQVVLLMRSQKRLGEKALLGALLLWDVTSPFFYAYLTLGIVFNRKKNRR